MPQSHPGSNHEWKWWVGAQLATSTALLAALLYGLWAYARNGAELPLPPWQRRGVVLLLTGGVVGFTARSLMLLAHFMGPPRR